MCVCVFVEKCIKFYLRSNTSDLSLSHAYNHDDDDDVDGDDNKKFLLLLIF